MGNLNRKHNFHWHFNDYYSGHYLGDYNLLHYRDRYYAHHNHNNPSHHGGSNDYDLNNHSDWQHRIS